jgi:hypothetical protein
VCESSGSSRKFAFCIFINIKNIAQQIEGGIHHPWSSYGGIYPLPQISADDSLFTLFSKLRFFIGKIFDENFSILTTDKIVFLKFWCQF